jgi:hypothetical protein
MISNGTPLDRIKISMPVTLFFGQKNRDRLS